MAGFEGAVLARTPAQLKYLLTQYGTTIRLGNTQFNTDKYVAAFANRAGDAFAAVESIGQGGYTIHKFSGVCDCQA